MESPSALASTTSALLQCSQAVGKFQGLQDNLIHIVIAVRSKTAGKINILQLCGLFCIALIEFCIFIVRNRVVPLIHSFFIVFRILIGDYCPV